MNVSNLANNGLITDTNNMQYVKIPAVLYLNISTFFESVDVASVTNDDLASIQTFQDVLNFIVFKALW